MWFGLRAGKAYMRTGAECWKVKRIAANPCVLIAPATARGRPLEPAVKSFARILPPEEHRVAIETRISNYGRGRWAYDHTIAHAYGAATYLEVSAIGWQSGPAL
jgi:PPOX class probable F420-dependent enzyme